MNSVGHSRLISTGISIPAERVTSQELMEDIDSFQRFGLPHDWLDRATGIQERRIAPADTLPSDLASNAARDALDSARLRPTDIDAIIYAGVIKDLIEPSTAHIVQHKLGAKNAISFDVSNACLGFMSAIHLMDSLIATGQVRRGLIVTGERGFKYAEKARTALLQTNSREQFNLLVAGLTLGDAGAAVVMGPKVDPDVGFMGFAVTSDGDHHSLCTCGNDEDDVLITRITEIISETAKLVAPLYCGLMGKLNWHDSDLKQYIPHQVGMKSIRIHANLTGVPTTKIPVTVNYLGNIVSATIPVNLHLLLAKNRLSEGDKIYLSGTGSGICLAHAGLILDAA